MALTGEVSINKGDQVAVLSHSQPARTNRNPNVDKIVMSKPGWTGSHLHESDYRASRNARS